MAGHETLQIPLISLLSALLCAGAFSTCRDTDAASPAQGLQTASIRQALPEAEYPIDLAGSGRVRLRDGFFAEPAAPDSSIMLVIRLGGERAFGDINGDGAEDAAVALVADPGGSGVFTYLALVINEKGTARPVASVLLGDRIVLKSLAIKPGYVSATMLARGPDEPMSEAPDVEITRVFELQGGGLVEANQ